MGQPPLIKAVAQRRAAGAVAGVRGDSELHW
jgi:hypothetical protein